MSDSLSSYRSGIDNLASAKRREALQTMIETGGNNRDLSLWLRAEFLKLKQGEKT